MRRSTYWMIAGYYYASQLLGLLSFCYDWRNGIARKRLGMSIHCGVLSLATFGIVPLILRIDWKLNSNDNGPDLHIKISGLMCLIRIGAVLVSLVWNWTKRMEFITTLNEFQGLRHSFLQKWPLGEALERQFENTLRLKFSCGLVANIVLMVSCLNILKTQFHIESPVVAAIAIVSSILNVIMTHYYFAVTNVNILLAVINKEIKRIVNRSAILFEQQRMKQIAEGHLVSQCRELTDVLDELAIAQYRLLILAHRINHLYDVQGACVVLTVYLNNVSVIYMTYMILQHEYLTKLYDQWLLCSLFVALVIYYFDLKIFLFCMLDFESLVAETGQLLKDRQTWLPTLDERLEESFKNFSLQLAKFPVEMKLVGLFEFDRSMAFSIFGSTISNAIVLMQYDYKHNSIK